MKTANKVMAILAMVVLALSAVSTAQADAITWGAATNIAADTDVLNTGSPVYAYAFGAEVWPNFPTYVNTVGFNYGNQNGGHAWIGGVWSATTDIILGSEPGNGGPYFGTGGQSAAYNVILKGGIYAQAAGTPPIWDDAEYPLTLNNLTSGKQYAVQVWSQSIYAGQKITLDGARTLQAAGTGQYSIGTFTADGTTQTFIVGPTDNSAGPLNALQVRDITPTTGDLIIEKYNDQNGNGIFGDPDNDPLLGGWTFSVNGPGLVGAVTDNAGLDEDMTDGRILITGLDPGQYNIMEEEQAGWTATYGVLVVTVEGGEIAVAEWANHYEPSAVAEPAGLGLIGVALLALRKRRS